MGFVLVLCLRTFLQQCLLHGSLQTGIYWKSSEVSFVRQISLACSCCQWLLWWSVMWGKWPFIVCIVRRVEKNCLYLLWSQFEYWWVRSFALPYPHWWFCKCRTKLKNRSREWRGKAPVVTLDGKWVSDKTVENILRKWWGNRDWKSHTMEWHNRKRVHRGCSSSLYCCTFYSETTWTPARKKMFFFLSIQQFK